MKQPIDFTKTFLGIEFGSTRIKAILIDEDFTPVASGSHDWENRFEGGYFTYSEGDIIDGLQLAYSLLKADLADKYGAVPSTFGAVGISGMMHGYLPFDDGDKLLTPFRTWRNTTTAEAAAELTELFGFNIPQRWSAAHLYQAILNGEEHVSKIAHINTLAGYIHFLLTGRRAVGTGEASGIFPIDPATKKYDAAMLAKFKARLAEKNFARDPESLLPDVMSAGESGAFLTSSGAALLDPEGDLKAGVPLCPPEGDAGTGMTATDSVRPRTGNVSAGTSIFAMLVLEKNLSRAYPQIDVVCTPDGLPAAMVHCNNCCCEIDAWASVFGEFAAAAGHPMKKSEVYDALYYSALKGDTDCGGVTAYNFLAAEHVIDTAGGCPSYFRTADSKMNLANFFRAEIMSSMAALKIGLDSLCENEHVAADKYTAHGGLFKTPGVAQQLMADGLGTPVSVMKTAGEGGAWGMAILAEYMVNGGGIPLADYLDSRVFAGMERTTLNPDKAGSDGFSRYIESYKARLK